jgi:signal peptidase I
LLSLVSPGLGQIYAGAWWPPGSFFVLGDNRGNSLDSRYKDFGYIPIANFVGTVRTIYWSTEPTRLLSRVQ